MPSACPWTSFAKRGASVIADDITARRQRDPGASEALGDFVHARFATAPLISIQVVSELLMCVIRTLPLRAKAPLPSSGETNRLSP